MFDRLYLVISDSIHLVAAVIGACIYLWVAQGNVSRFRKGSTVVSSAFLGVPLGREFSQGIGGYETASIVCMVTLIWFFLDVLRAVLETLRSNPRLVVDEILKRTVGK